MYDLNEEQIKAITSKSPTIIKASAGSGKTRCLIAKIRLLMDSGVHPKNILAITFTNKAANEMKDRLKLYYSKISELQISTIHSMCVRIIKTFTQYTPLKVPFSIYDNYDQISIVKTIMKARKIKEDPWEVLSSISYAKSEGTTEKLNEEILEIYNNYQDILLKNNACDFDDLLIYALKCVSQHSCRTYYSNLWRHILIDEFQDTSVIQYKIISSLYDPTKTHTFFVIGDENQSIYSWRGAHPENMENFIKNFNPTVCHLTYNYRSCSEIINHANKFLQYGKRMIAKTINNGKVSFTHFINLEDEANKIAEAVMAMKNYEKTAILYRMNSRSLMFERAFASRKIPYKVIGDLPFYGRRVVKDLISYCKASRNDSDIESLVRIVNVPNRGFGETRQEKLLKEGKEYLIQQAKEMPQIKDLINLLEDIKSMIPIDAINTIIERTNYSLTLKNESDVQMLETFINIVSTFKTLDELILASTFLEEDSGKGVKLMTAHASKGLEFDYVFVVGLEQGVWPHILTSNIQEEERLFFVACTRARRYLNLSYSKSKIVRGALIQNSPSYLFIKSYRPA